MKLFILGVTRRKGKSDEGKGSDYDMARLNSLTSISSRVNEHNNFTASGFRQMEVELAPESIGQFLDLKYPCEVEVTTDSRPSQNGLVTVVTGLAKQ